jgi:serine/threonine protein kinase
MLVASSFVSRRARGPHPDPKAEDHQHRHRRKGILLRKPSIAIFFFYAAASVVGLWGLALLLLHRRLPRLESMTGLDPFLRNEAPIGMPSRIVFYSPASKLSAQRLRQPMLPPPRPGLVVAVAANSTGPSLHGGRSNGTRRSSSKQRQVPAALHYEEDLVLHIKSGRRSSPVACQPPAWSFLHFPNCNRFHEWDLAAMPQNDDSSRSPHDTTRAEEDSYVIARGYYRDVWVLVESASTAGSSGNNKVVLKTTRFQHDVDVDSLMNAKRDALVMERLASHDNIVSAFGHCGTSTVVEALPYQVEQYVVPKETRDQKSDNSHNNNMYTPTEKVQMALEMAESLAALHGFAGGAISHNDVQLSQWLRSRADRLVLGDFHSSRILSWNHRQQRYCLYSTGTVFGNVRTVEWSATREC